MSAKGKAGRAPSAAFHAVTHVWGAEYLDVFLNVCIPNQLAPGNVPSLPAGSRYRILTRAMHVPELEAHPMVHALRDVIPVDLIVVGELDWPIGAGRSNDLMIACHQRAVADVLEAGAAIIFLSADFVLSDNVLAAVVRLHREGYRAVVNTGLRLNKESFLRELRDAGASAGALPPRQLVKLALPHLHAHTASMLAAARPASSFPVAAYWTVEGEGVLARCLHLHPLMVDPMTFAPLKGSADGRYLFRACPDASRLHVVTDSDELQMFELTPAGRTVVPSGASRLSPWRMAAVAAACDDHQIGFLRHTVRLHAGEVDQRWTPAEAAAAAFVERVLALGPYGSVVRRWFRFLEHSRQRRERYWRAWRRRRPRVSLKRVLRPVRVATSRAGKTLRKTTRQVRRHVGAHSR